MPGWISHSRAKQSWSFVFNLLDNISVVSTRVFPALHLRWFCTDSFKMTSDLGMVAKQHYLAKPDGIYSGQHWSHIVGTFHNVYLLTPVLPDFDVFFRILRHCFDKTVTSMNLNWLVERKVRSDSMYKQQSKTEKNLLCAPITQHAQDVHVA